MPDKLTTAQIDHKVYNRVVKPAARLSLVVLGPIAIYKTLILSHLVSSRLMEVSTGMCLRFGFLLFSTLWFISLKMPKEELKKIWAYKRWLIVLPTVILILFVFIAKFLFDIE